jgi:ubiquinone/menaquinone biosynthesis C-methylase UbiE
MASDTIPENLKSRLKDSYDAMAETYNAWTEQHLVRRHEALDQLIPLLKKRDGPLSILELGCGSGVPVIQTILAQLDTKYVANDMSSTQISTAKKNLGPELEQRVIFIEGDMLSVSQPNVSHDAVIALFSIIHVPREEQVQLMATIFKWLKPGGYLMANFGEDDMPAFSMPHWLHEKGFMFWSGWGAEGTVVKLKEAGFEILEEATKPDVVDVNFLWILARKA